MIANVKGLVMNDFVKETEFEGVKKQTRVIYLFQKDAESRELVEIKDIPETFKCDFNKETVIPCDIKHWRNPKGQSGISIKFFS